MVREKWKMNQKEHTATPLRKKISKPISPCLGYTLATFLQHDHLQFKSICTLLQMFAARFELFTRQCSRPPADGLSSRYRRIEFIISKGLRSGGVDDGEEGEESVLNFVWITGTRLVFLQASKSFFSSSP